LPTSHRRPAPTPPANHPAMLAVCGEAIECGFRPPATMTAPGGALAPHQTCSCRTARRPNRPRPWPFDCAHRARGSTP